MRSPGSCFGGAALDESGGRVSVDAVMSRIEANYGDQPSRGSLASLGMHIGANLNGEWLVRKPAS